MGASTLSSRAIIGEFYATLEQNTGALWVPSVSSYFDSNQESETYGWLGMAPAMREWIGGRFAKGFRENAISIRNKLFEATIEVTLDEMRRDKTGQVLARIRELAIRTNAHWAKLLTTQIVTGESVTCYDGVNFFATTHSEGDSGTQSNSITSAAATTTAPKAAEMESAILKSIEQILSLKDDQGEPMNEEAASFLIMVPTSFMASTAAAIKNPVIVDGDGSRTNTISSMGGFNIELAVNPRLSWTTKFATFRTDGSVKSLIRQEEEAVKLDAIAEGSELEFTKNLHQYGVKTSRNVGFGYWQHACLTTLT
jgi:phage major head subunit gpT-like protein